MKINSLNSQIIKPPVTGKAKEENPLEVKDTLDLNSSKLDTAGIIGGVTGGILGGAGVGYLGLEAGAGVALVSSLVFLPETLGDFAGRIALGGTIGGAVGFVSGAVLGAYLGKTAADYATGKKHLITESDNPDVARKGNKSDNFDHFKGVDLGFVHIGKFTEGPKEFEQTETVKPSDIMPEDQAKKMTEGMLKALTSPWYKPDMSTLKMDPDATVTHYMKEEETFKGIAIGKDFKIGSDNHQLSEMEEPSKAIVFHFDGEVQGKKRKDIKHTLMTGNPKGIKKDK